MAEILKGAEVTSALNIRLKQRAEALKSKGITPCLSIVRVGANEADLAYERGAEKRCAAIGAEVRKFALDEAASQEELIKLIESINADKSIHGCLLLRPLPKHMDDNTVRNTLCPEKDVDGITDQSLCGVFTGSGRGYPPCTAAACIEILDHFGIDIEGRHAVIVGRSLVVGKPLAMLLLSRNATVTVCHTRTRDLKEQCRRADILITAAGRAKVIGEGSFSPGQTVIDVGINAGPDGKLLGDADFEAAISTSAAVTPVPGGVGTVTSSVLVKHVIEAAERSAAL